MCFCATGLTESTFSEPVSFAGPYRNTTCQWGEYLPPVGANLQIERHNRAFWYCNLQYDLGL